MLNILIKNKRVDSIRSISLMEKNPYKIWQKNPKNILIETTKSDDAIYCSGIFILLSGTSLYLLSNIFS
jgi:hypothetical protein